jgi:radical SAM superfamily enzyme YgiQ (UPF0313 family)
VRVKLGHMKIKLILAASRSDPLRKNDPFMPLSLPILAGIAPEHEYEFVDMLWEDDVRYGEPVDLVGISVRYTAEKRAYEIADEFRKRGVRVVLGGPQPTVVPFRAIKHADAVVVGEAEDLWPVLLRDAENQRLKNFYVCSGKKFDAGSYTAYKKNSYPDLKKNARPARKLFRKKYVFDTVYAVRGCPINCDFCAVTGIFGAGFRMKPVEEVTAEINQFRNYYYLLDDSVFGKPATYEYYLRLYDSISRLEKRRYWTGQANLDAAGDKQGRKVIMKAAQAGLLYAAVGMESVNPATLAHSGAVKKMGAGAGTGVIRKMRDNIAFIQDQGIIVSGWFVVGYEDDDIDTYFRTLEFCKEMNVIPVIFPVKAMPGTRLYERLRKQHKLDDSKLINFRNSAMRDEEVFAALRKIGREGYRWKEILKRTRFYASKFKIDKIHKSIFALVLQSKLRGAIDVSNDEFYAGP